MKTQRESIKLVKQEFVNLIQKERDSQVIEVHPPVPIKKIQSLKFELIKNNHTRSNLIKLAHLKCIISQQLPKMPRQYITKLLFDGKHECFIAVKQQNQMVGGICFRSFTNQDFVQIVFLAVQQCFKAQKIGSSLMEKLKEKLQARQIKLILTYADNTATGFFQRHAFKPVIQTPTCSWKGFIKVYLQGTLMQCKLDGKFEYTRLRSMMEENRRIIFEQIKKIPKFTYNSKTYFNFKRACQKLGYWDIQFLPGLTERNWSTLQQLEIQSQSQYSSILQQLIAIKLLRKIPQARIIESSPEALQGNNSIVETFSSLQKKALSFNFLQNKYSISNSFINMLQVCYSKIKKDSPIFRDLIQFDQKSQGIMRSLKEKKLVVNIQPFILEKNIKKKQTKEDKSENSQKSRIDKS